MVKRVPQGRTKNQNGEGIFGEANPQRLTHLRVYIWCCFSFSRAKILSRDPFIVFFCGFFKQIHFFKRLLFSCCSIGSN